MGLRVHFAKLLLDKKEAGLWSCEAAKPTIDTLALFAQVSQLGTCLLVRTCPIWFGKGSTGPGDTSGSWLGALFG